MTQEELDALLASIGGGKLIHSPGADTKEIPNPAYKGNGGTSWTVPEKISVTIQRWHDPASGRVIEAYPSAAGGWTVVRNTTDKSLVNVGAAPAQSASGTGDNPRVPAGSVPRIEGTPTGQKDAQGNPIYDNSQPIRAWHAPDGSIIYEPLTPAEIQQHQQQAVPPPSASGRVPVEGYPGIYAVKSQKKDPTTNTTTEETHYENEAGQTVPDPHPAANQGTSAQDALAGHPGWTVRKSTVGGQTKTVYIDPQGAEHDTPPAEAPKAGVQQVSRNGRTYTVVTSLDPTTNTPTVRTFGPDGQEVPGGLPDEQKPAEKPTVGEGPGGGKIQYVPDPDHPGQVKAVPVPGSEKPKPPPEAGEYVPDINKPAFGVVEYTQRVYALLAAGKITQQQAADAITLAQSAATSEAHRIDSIRAAQQQDQSNQVAQRNADLNASVSRGSQAVTVGTNAINTGVQLAGLMTPKNFVHGVVPALLGIQHQNAEWWGGLEKPARVGSEGYPLLQGLNQLGLPQAAPAPQVAPLAAPAEQPVTPPPPTSPPIPPVVPLEGADQGTAPAAAGTVPAFRPPPPVPGSETPVTGGPVSQAAPSWAPIASAGTVPVPTAPVPQAPQIAAGEPAPMQVQHPVVGAVLGQDPNNPDWAQAVAMASRMLGLG
jgi:hypothetical protein